MRTVLSRLVLITVVAAAAAACGGKKKASTTPDTTVRKGGDGGGTSARRQEQPATSGVSVDRGDASTPSFRAVYFEFDSAVLTAEAREELAQLGEWLVEHGDATVTIEGHADERGTDEYNIALGERRAQVIQEYLTRLGVPARQLRTISYGEERPAVAGSSEEAWAQNRRGELKPNR